MKRLLLILLLLTGCSDIQLVCPTGHETDEMVIAVEYWANQGRAIMIADSSECSIRTRLSETPLPGEQWGLTQIGGHKLYDIGLTDLEPSHLIQSEVRFRTSKWNALPFSHRLFCAIHELGHIWEREHPDTFPMQADIPKDVVNQLILAGIPAAQLEEKKEE